ncbi:hypothetical protein V6N13_072309 [Hibiscus sabdariffa]
MLSDDGSPRHRGKSDLSDFKNSVEDCLDYEPKPVEKHAKLMPRSSSAIQVENFSGLRIRNLLVKDTIYACWVTIAVLTENGIPKTSSIRPSYSIWKFGCLDENTLSLFLFGDYYKQNCKEQVGTVFALCSCSVCKDPKSAANRILKIGTSANYGVCKGKKTGWGRLHACRKQQWLLSRLGRGDFQLDMPVIVLAYHVDYWDYMRWKDPYGSSLSTIRQKAYVEALILDTIFTPQVVVQGRAQCVVNEEDTLLSTITNAPRSCYIIIGNRLVFYELAYIESGKEIMGIVILQLSFQRK